MKQFLFCIFLLLSISVFANTEILYLLPNTTESIPVKSNESIKVTSSHVVQIKDLGNKIVLIAKEAGSTQISIGKNKFIIVVSSAEVLDSYKRLAQLIQFMPSLDLNFINTQLIVSGSLSSIADWISLAKSGARNWFMRAEFRESEVYLVENELKKDLQKMGSFPFSIKLTPNPSVLIPKIMMTDNTLPLSLLKSYGLEIKVDPKAIDVEPLIRVKVSIAEIDKSSQTQLGVKWPNSYSATLLNTGALSGGQLSPDLMVKALTESGHGQILATPILLARSGKEAEFLAGGEIPIRLVGTRDAKITWKQYGIKLKIKPETDAAQHIRLELETEVSSVDNSRSVDGIPAFVTNKINSHFDLVQAQTVMLSGLMKKIDQETLSGLPALSQLPILGPLFSSKTYREDKSELVVLVTPEIVTQGY